MKEIIYNKLVRDKIPEIILQEGKKCQIHIASSEEYGEVLNKKLKEEIDEFLAQPCEEELADIFEVIEALIGFYGFDDKSIKAIKDKKKVERGSFLERIILEKVIE